MFEAYELEDLYCIWLKSAEFNRNQTVGISVNSKSPRTKAVNVLICGVLMMNCKNPIVSDLGQR